MQSNMKIFLNLLWILFFMATFLWLPNLVNRIITIRNNDKPDFLILIIIGLLLWIFDKVLWLLREKYHFGKPTIHNGIAYITPFGWFHTIIWMYSLVLVICGLIGLIIPTLGLDIWLWLLRISP